MFGIKKVTLIFVLIACVFGADLRFQEQPQEYSKYAVADGRFHQDPNLEYNFECVLQ